MVVEIDRNPGAYPDGNVAEVCLWSRDSGGEVVDVRLSGRERKHKRRPWTVSHYAKLVTRLPGFGSSSTLITSPLNTNFTLTLVSPIFGRRFPRADAQ